MSAPTCIHCGRALVTYEHASPETLRCPSCTYLRAGAGRYSPLVYHRYEGAPITIGPDNRHAGAFARLRH